MSSYLLLRNNQESGPYTIEQIKGMSLKAYDLLWVVGKSAAWRYPGEIPELKSFAPAVPGDMIYPVTKRTGSGNTSKESVLTKTTDPEKKRESPPKQSENSHNLYVNLPADRKQNVLPDLVQFENDLPPVAAPEYSYDFSNLNKNKRSRSVRNSGRFLLIGTIFLLFGAGMLTGLFISDRRNFNNENEKKPQVNPSLRPAAMHNQEQNNKVPNPAAPLTQADEMSSKAKDSIKLVNLIPEKKTLASGSKKKKTEAIKKDTINSQATLPLPLIPKENPSQNTASKSDLVYLKIKAHPENYISLEAGRYSTGIFGGISSFPVTVINNSPVKLDQVIVSIDYIQNNEKIYKTERLSFNDLQPGEAVTIKAPKSPRGIKVATRIHYVNVHQPDPGYPN